MVETQQYTDTTLKKMYEAGYPQGVVVNPTPITAGDEITILYHGFLAKGQDDQLFVRVGYGDARNWHNVQDYKMSKTGWGWVKKLKVTDDSRLNICFRDSNNNWDNNNGMNWSFEIHNGKVYNNY